MKVILQQNVANLGKVGDSVQVKAGFARNYLLPQQKAMLATPANMAAFEQRRAELELAAQTEMQAAQARAQTLAGVTVVIEALASEEGKLFGSVGPREVADAFTAAGASVNKSEVVMPEGPIRDVGDAVVMVQLHPEVTQELKFTVQPEAAATENETQTDSPA